MNPSPHPLKELALELFERREFSAAIDALRLERRLRPPDPELVMLELVCRSALGQARAGELLEDLGAGPGGPPELAVLRPWLPEGSESCDAKSALEGSANRFIPRLSPKGTTP